MRKKHGVLPGQNLCSSGHSFKVENERPIVSLLERPGIKNYDEPIGWAELTGCDFRKSSGLNQDEPTSQIDCACYSLENGNQFIVNS